MIPSSPDGNVSPSVVDKCSRGLGVTHVDYVFHIHCGGESDLYFDADIFVWDDAKWVDLKLILEKQKITVQVLYGNHRPM